MGVWFFSFARVRVSLCACVYSADCYWSQIVPTRGRPRVSLASLHFTSQSVAVRRRSEVGVSSSQKKLLRPSKSKVRTLVGIVSFEFLLASLHFRTSRTGDFSPAAPLVRASTTTCTAAAEKRADGLAAALSNSCVQNGRLLQHSPHLTRCSLRKRPHL